MTRRNAEGGNGASTAALFGEVLRHYREAALLTQEALSREIPCDRSQVAKIEAGTRVPHDGFAMKCDEVLDTGGELAKLWAKVDWYPQVEHPDWFRRRAEVDAVLIALRAYHERVVPGLLQTEDYARALFNSRISDPDVVGERVRARLSRQQRSLAPPRPPFYAVVLDESCLRNPMGNAAIMRDQCAHLLRVGRHPNIHLQVAPSDVYGLDRPSGPYRDAMKGYEHHAEARAERGKLDQEQPQRRQRWQLPGNGDLDQEQSQRPDGGDCIEIAPAIPDVVPVRDSKNPEGPVLLIPHAAWRSFVAAVPTLP